MALVSVAPTGRPTHTATHMSYQQQSIVVFPAMANPVHLAVSCAMSFAMSFAIVFGDAAQATEVVSRMRNNPLIQQAILDLAKRESVSLDEIELESFEEVVWPDTGMGCPLPDMQYKQVPQDGARIVLRVKGEVREYHSGGNRPPFLCAPATARLIPRRVPVENK